MKLKVYPTPVWAQKLISEVCREEGISRPSVRWMKRPTHSYSSGKAWPWHIQIVAGGNRKEVRTVLLHELSHSVLGQSGAAGRNTHHGAEFYAKFFKIAKRHGIGAMYIKKREKWYKPRGMKAGYRLYLARLKEARVEA